MSQNIVHIVTPKYEWVGELKSRQPDDYGFLTLKDACSLKYRADEKAGVMRLIDSDKEVKPDIKINIKHVIEIRGVKESGEFYRVYKEQNSGLIVPTAQQAAKVSKIH